MLQIDKHQCHLTPLIFVATIPKQTCCLLRCEQCQIRRSTSNQSPNVRSSTKRNTRSFFNPPPYSRMRVHKINGTSGQWRLAHFLFACPNLANVWCASVERVRKSPLIGPANPIRKLQRNVPSLSLRGFVCSRWWFLYYWLFCSFNFQVIQIWEANSGFAPRNSLFAWHPIVLQQNYWRCCIVAVNLLKQMMNNKKSLNMELQSS